MRAAIACAMAGALLAGCTAGPPAHLQAACSAQGYAPGTDEWRYCIDGAGAPIATGPGSPYAKADEEDDDR